MTTRRNGRRRDATRETTASPLAREPDPSQLSDVELMRRLAKLKPEKYGGILEEMRREGYMH